MSDRTTTPRRAFTLIELLIVVAIIAILAAIAVPNFLEAQVRAKIARSEADMRTLATGIEAYCVDQNSYPEPDQANFAIPTYLLPITTPVAYLGALPAYTWAPFWYWMDNSGGSFPDAWGGSMYQAKCYRYECKGYWDKSAEPYPGTTFTWKMFDSKQMHNWWLAAVGPDGVQNQETGVDDCMSLAYDASNGTVSKGDIIRMGP
jgi:prepilin-type N-terminal cleavage/methylation domain-containing protein